MEIDALAHGAATVGALTRDCPFDSDGTRPAGEWVHYPFHRLPAPVSVRSIAMTAGAVLGA